MRVSLAVIVALAGATSARADTYTVQRGETLETVAAAFHCSTAELERFNHVDTSLVPPFTVVAIPICGKSIRARAAQRAPRTRDPVDDDAGMKARVALAVIDGTAPIVPIVRPADPDDGAPTTSVGEPWHGQLRHGRALPASEAYAIRRPTHAYGTTHVVDELRAAIADVRARYTDVHPLAIGDLSAEHGGKLADHLSHQSGLDVDVGFYFTKVPVGYPAAFVAANPDFDLEANWALLVAFTRTSAEPGGVQMIFLDYDVQARLYRYALGHGASRDDLARVFQYPRGKDTPAGIVRHWPAHGDHFHVRYKP